MDLEVTNRLNVRIVTLPVIFLLGLLIFVFRTFVLPEDLQEHRPGASLIAVLDNLVAAAIASFFAGLVILFLTRESQGDLPHLAKGGRLKRSFKSDSASTDTWKVRARTGSFFVRDTLPNLAEHRGGTVKVVLMDPSRAEDLANYEALRPRHSDGNWSPVRIRADIIVSLIRIFQIQSHYPRLNVEVGVASAGWVQSLDISYERAYLCGQDRGDLALVVPRSHELYDRFCDDFEAAFKLAKAVRIPSSFSKDIGSHLQGITEETIEVVSPYFLDELDIDLSDETSDLNRMVIDRSVKGHHYG
ncbi:hypothetical protein G6030_04900 [Dietzia sp. E1]|uniref:hypothetical protein n=1 Tax=Dietzia sp. E1 TaxID=328361 RepID=UPI0015F93F25|nr:hypothetical protein [Dietzia sp. E1]MBB1020632.1 hypothetical protein [Dietzia sp. E1]